MLTNATAHIAKPIGMHLDNHINAKDLVDVGNLFGCKDAFTTLLQGHQRHCTMWTMDICGSKELHNAHENFFWHRCLPGNRRRASKMEKHATILMFGHISQI